MPFLPPNQQRQSTEALIDTKAYTQTDPPGTASDQGAFVTINGFTLAMQFNPRYYGSGVL